MLQTSTEPCLPFGWARLPEYCRTVRMRLCLDHEYNMRKRGVLEITICVKIEDIGKNW